MELTLENIEGDPFLNFLEYIRSSKTRDLYMSYLGKFLDVIPNEIFVQNLQEDASDDIEKKATQFVRISQKNIKVTKQIIHAYVKELKIIVDNRELKPSAIKNRLKPIKALFAANEIDFSWKLINKGLM